MAEKVKVKQPYLKYDSIIIGPGAKQLDPGYFEDWLTFGRATSLKWFTDRASAVPNWATSTNTDRSDWPLEVHQGGVEFYAPYVDRQVNINITDNFMPQIFTTKLPVEMEFNFQIADTDLVLKLPGVHAPAGVGPFGIVYDASPAGIIAPAINGEPLINNSWKFPDPMRISTRTTITVSSRVEDPLIGLFTGGLTGPGFKAYPINPAGQIYNLPNWYVIRVWLRGARFIENIAARG